MQSTTFYITEDENIVIEQYIQFSSVMQAFAKHLQTIDFYLFESARRWMK